MSHVIGEKPEDLHRRVVSMTIPKCPKPLIPEASEALPWRG
jgi:hypothetical protein